MLESYFSYCYRMVHLIKLTCSRFALISKAALLGNYYTVPNISGL